jgi:F0F1-type ATP synthase membrane subunit b/b'
MFRMSLGIRSRTARGLAAAALILSLSATTAGSANAAPLAENDCSAAAHARNDAVHLLHTAWKAFDGDLKQLARDARKLQHETEKTSAAATKDARSTVASAKAELRDIVSQAHEDIQAVVELGTACKDNEDEDSTSATTAATTTTTTAPTNATAPAVSSGSAHTFDTSGLDAKYKNIVDQAIKDMQAAVDAARKAVLDLTATAESKETTEKDVEKVEQEVEKAKADRATAKQDREEAKKADKAKEKVKAATKSQNSDKGNAKTKAKFRHANTNEERD